MRTIRYSSLLGLVCAAAMLSAYATTSDPVDNLYVIDDGCGQFLCVGHMLARPYPPTDYFEAVGHELCSDAENRRVETYPSDEGDMCTTYHGVVSDDCEISLIVFTQDKEIYRLVEESSCNWDATWEAIEARDAE